MTFGTAMLVLSASEYFFLYPRVFFKPQEAVYRAYHFFILMHVGGMIVAASMGPTQFLSGLRARRPKLHRNMGKLYIAGCIVGGIGGIVMSLHSRSGVWSGSAFFVLAVLLLISVSEAYIKIRGRHIQEHREWMTRSFAMLFAAVTLRLYFPVLRTYISDYDAFAITAWLSWTLNLVVAEWLIRRQREGGLELARMPAGRPSTPLANT